MSWQLRVPESLSGTCKFLLRISLLVDTILVSLFGIWLVFKLCWFTLHWLSRTLFSKPW